MRRTVSNNSEKVNTLHNVIEQKIYKSNNLLISIKNYFDFFSIEDPKMIPLVFFMYFLTKVTLIKIVDQSTKTVKLI